MPSADDSSARPKGSGSSKDELAYYKAQYEQLEVELSDFQASSRELEAELEKDIEASEKRERQLKERLDNLRYEVDEWKTKYKQSKSEGGAAQNALQKEITTLRDTNRTLQLKLRDIEVVNDDYERQARNTTSSLEDLESKYNVAIERGVLLEEEIKNGEQERENLRIENQRLRDEFSDLKIETEIVQERLRNAESQGARRRKPMPMYRSPSTPHTPDLLDRSPRNSAYSPIFDTPPNKFSLASSTATPPSPPISETSTSMRKSINATPGFPRQKASAGETLNSRSMYSSRTQRFSNSHSRASSLAYSNGNGRSTPSVSSRNSMGKPNGNRSTGLPNSSSLYQIRGLIGKMQKLEERVQSAKSKLPAPSDSPSRASSRSGSVIGESPVTSTIAIRGSARKRLSGSSLSSSVRDGDSLPSYAAPGRQSIGIRTQGDSRPSSRTSYSSRSSFSQTMHPGMAPSARPESRQSRTSNKTPLGHYSTNPTTESRRPRSSLSNQGGQNTSVGSMSLIDENDGGQSVLERNHTRLQSTSTPSTNGVKLRSASGISAIPAPRSLKSSIGVDRREGNMGPPDRKPQAPDLGETY